MTNETAPIAGRVADTVRTWREQRRARAAQQTSFYRHSALVRVLHWINALCLLVMLMSGLQIFNAHPALYWGNLSDFDHPFVSLFGLQDNAGNIRRGVSQIGHWQFNTTGVFGASYEDGQLTARGFPAWATLPGRAMAGDGPAVALFLRLDLRDQRGAVRGLGLAQAACPERPAADAQGYRPSRPRSRRPYKPALSQGRGGEALQRAAEAGLFRGDFRPAARSSCSPA